jgi:transposase
VSRFSRLRSALAPASQGAGPHADHESTASRSSQGRAALQEALWRERGRQQLEAFQLAPWASRRRRDLLELLDRLNPTIAELTQAIEQEAEKYRPAQRLRTHPGVGALTGLAFVLIIGEADRFHCGKQVASYLGLVPLEDSGGNRRRLGHITKQGSLILRFLLVEGAQVTGCRNGAVSTFTWRCGGEGRSPRWRWRGNSPFAFTGCGARDGIMSS